MSPHSYADDSLLEEELDDKMDKVNKLDDKVDKLEDKVDKVNKLDDKVDKLEDRVDKEKGLDYKVDKEDDKLDKLDERMTSWLTRWTK